MQPIDAQTLFPPGVRLALLYDGHCGLCRASIGWLRRRDRAHRLNPIPLQTPGALAFFKLSQAAAEGELNAFSQSGERRGGADAVFWAVSLLPRFGFVGPLLRVPGVLPIARAVYRQVAKRRRRDVCAGDACAIH